MEGRRVRGRGACALLPPGRGALRQRMPPSRTHRSLPTSLAPHYAPGPLGVLGGVPASRLRRRHEAQTAAARRMRPGARLPSGRPTRAAPPKSTCQSQQRFRPALPGRVAPGLPPQRAGRRRSAGPRPRPAHVRGGQPQLLGQMLGRSLLLLPGVRLAASGRWRGVGALGQCTGKTGLRRGGPRGDPARACLGQCRREACGRLSMRVAVVPTSQGHERQTGVRSGWSVSLVRLKDNWFCKQIFGGGLWPVTLNQGQALGWAALCCIHTAGARWRGPSSSQSCLRSFQRPPPEKPAT